jgi:hypothetical protein
MRRERFVLLFLTTLAFVGFTASPGRAQADAAATPETQRVTEFMRARKHAYEQVDAAAWGMHVAEQCSFIEAGGRVLSKAQFIAEMVPFVGYTFSAVVSDVQATKFGDTIVLTYREKDVRDYGTQRSVNTYIDTETYARLEGAWQLILFTENALPVEPATAKLNPQIYEKYVGTYEVNPRARFAVTREGNKLMGQYSGEEKFELLPASRSSFFTHGDGAEYLFLWDKSGRVVGHIYRADGAEIKYKKK